MNIFLSSRRALLTGTLSLSLIGLLTGCSGSDGGNNNRPSNNNNISTRARVSFSDTSATTANTSAFDLGNLLPTVDANVNPNGTHSDANATGIHAATSDFTGLTELHVLLLARSGSLSRTMNFNFLPESQIAARNPVQGKTFDLGKENETGQVAYFERQGSDTARVWVALSGRLAVTDVTSSSYTLTLTNATFRRSDGANDSFTASGSVVLRKADIAIETDDTFHSHEAGFGNGGLVNEPKVSGTHAEKSLKKW